MPKISMKELEKFMKDNPNSPATQAIKEQLKDRPAPAPSIGGCSELTAGPGQIRNTASYLAAGKVNELHREVLNGLKGVCIKAIEIGEILLSQKNALKHGEWLVWVDRLDIGPRQVQNYIKIYNRKEAVLDAMDELAESGLKPSFRKMLAAATNKDSRTAEQYLENHPKDRSDLTPKQRKQRRKDEKRENEISTLAKIYMDKEIDDSSLTALVIKWNMDNPDNSLLFVKDVKEAVRQMDEELYPDIFDPDPSLKTNITLSIDADLWDSYLEFGGKEVFLDIYVSEFVANYANEQRFYRIAK